MPLLPTLDRGKSRLAICRDLADAVAQILAYTAKVLTEEWRQWQKGQAKAVRENQHQQKAREHQIRSQRVSWKTATFEVMMPAYLNSTNHETITVESRDQYYEVRPRLEEFSIQYTKSHKTGEVITELSYDYFSQNLLPAYRREVHPLPMIDYKARGILYEPHTGKEIPIGDKELRDWQFPLWQYNKILFIEKQGVWTTLKQTGGLAFAKRHDMAIVSAVGFATEAIRLLMAKAQQNEGYQIFVFHDADPYGYNIARTLAEETARMPNHRIEVFDLGLQLEEAIRMELVLETHTRKIAIPETIRPRLTEVETRLFEGVPQEIGEDTTLWTGCQRVEINAIPISQRVA
jgi:hypothetical protein